MLQEFYQHLSKIRTRSCWKAVIALFLVVLPCIAIAFIQINLLLSGVLFCSSVVLIIAFCFMNRKMIKPDNDPWYITVSGVHDMIHQNSFIEILPSVFFLQKNYKRTNIRMLAQFEKLFSSDAVSQKRTTANKKVNKVFGHKRKVSMYEAARSLRINFVACEKHNKELIDWVAKTNQTLHRSESIINIAFIEESNQLVIPFLYGQFDVSEIKRYAVAVEYILMLMPPI